MSEGTRDDDAFVVCSPSCPAPPHLPAPLQHQPRCIGVHHRLHAISQRELCQNGETWVLYVASPTDNDSAISAFDKPRAEKN